MDKKDKKNGNLVNINVQYNIKKYYRDFYEKISLYIYEIYNNICY